MFDRLGSFLRSYLDGEDDVFSKPANNEKSYSTNTSQQTSRESNAYQYSTRQQYSSGSGSTFSSRTVGSSSGSYYSARQSSSAASSAHSSTASQSRTVPVELFKDFIRLGLTPGASMESCKEAHKTLLKKYHPDRHAGSEISLIRANEMSSMINMSYQRICHWLKTGRIE